MDRILAYQDQAHSWLMALYVLFVAYFLIEFWLAGVYPANPLSMDHMPYKVDMNVR